MAKQRIETLTDEQVALMGVYRDKWISIGLATGAANRPKAEQGIRRAYQAGRCPIPERIVWCQSPMSQTLTRAVVVNMQHPSVRDSVRASVRDSVRASVLDSVWASVGDSVRASVRDSVLASVLASVRDSVRDSVLASVGASVRDSVRDSGYGQHDAYWLAYYHYFSEVCDLRVQMAPLQGLWDIAESAGWWLPHKRICWVSERPIALHRDEQGRLHSDTTMAIEYPDGWGIWALHGVRVPAELVKTPAEDLDPHVLVRETNAEIRREVVRKIGIERICKELGAQTIDTQDDYALLLLDLGDGRRRPYLKMRNPSIGVYHLEGVHPECQTVEQALNWRNGTKVRPEVLT